MQGQLAYNEVTAPPRMSQVREEIEMLHKSAQILSDTIDTLQSRIDDLLRPGDPSPDKPGAVIKTERCRVPLAQTIFDARTTIEDSITRLNNIRDRVEL